MKNETAISLGTFAAALVLSVACASEQRRESDARTAVLELSVRHYLAMDKDSESSFVSIDDSDPDPQFLARFVGTKPTVRPGSEWKNSSTVSKIDIRDVRRLGPNEFAVSGNIKSFEGGWGSGLNLRKTGRKWIVAGETGNGVFSMGAWKRFFPNVAKP